MTADLPSPRAVSRPVARRSERQLLEALAAGDRSAGSELVDRTYRAVWAALYRFTGGDPELASDLTQETYRRAWAAIGAFDGRAALSTWLYRIAQTTYLNHIRRPRRVTPLEPELEATITDPAEDGETTTIRSQEAERLRRAVLTLPGALRDTVAARFWGELPVREIAASEGLTEPAVRKRLAKAYRLLAAALEVSR